MGCDRLILGTNDDEEREQQQHWRQNSDDVEEQKDERVSEDRDNRVTPSAAHPLGGLASARRVVSDDDDYSDDTDIEEEMMRIDPGDIEWRRQLHVGDPLDAQNVFGNWCPATILRMADGELRIKYLNMNDAWHRWLPSDSGQLAQPATKTRNDSSPVRLAQQIEVRKTVHGVWKEAHVVRCRPSDILVRYAGRQQQFDEWIPFVPDTVVPLGEHIHHRNFSMQRQLSVNPKTHAPSHAQNPRFEQYRNALEAQGLQIYPIEGDGNCLFRSVSHQVYGDDRHHAVVRAMCMDYMESEKEYFEPYVVGDMEAFLRYLNYKRRQGVWGDDPELQAMCELYDRPAEVYAYDPVHGFRKLRTFHESSGLSRNRPPICLSYYGGGHYDSLVGMNHSENCIRDPPGEWERRHLEYSRRINTREQDDSTSEVARQVQAESDRETTEMAQLEQTLLLSRNEFDGMNSNLDETLKLSLEEYENSNAATASVGTSDAQIQEAKRESEMTAIQADLIAKAKQASEEELMKKAIEASLETLPAGANDMDFDDQVSAAIKASLGHLGHNKSAGAGGATTAASDYDEQLRLALELSAQEYTTTASDWMFSPGGGEHTTASGENDEDAELQRAIQASLQQS
uniref:ubiquitinyl hydrolase 1 n=1 Tax=Globisporangium ultimum (strain ATCC 200006 / CBS 805.95 / DAOM BR144) TaxID=431595 RepID=K3WER0_GLOUD